MNKSILEEVEALFLEEVAPVDSIERDEFRVKGEGAQRR